MVFLREYYPFAVYEVLLTKTVYRWGSVGIDISASYSVSSAATLTEDGGVENSSSGGGGAPGGGAPPS